MKEVECAYCHKPVRSEQARARRIGSGCWRKLRPDQRAKFREYTRGRGWSLGPREASAILSRPAPAGTGQLPLTQELQASGPPTRAHREKRS